MLECFLMGKKVKRLFEQFQPQHYVLELQPDKESMTFTGSVTIIGQKVGQPSHKLILHYKDLRISSANVIKHDKKGDQSYIVNRVNHHKSFDEARIHTKDKIYPGRYTIRLDFSGKITRQMNGIYPCLFDHEGQKKKLIATQFESHYARQVFPCIDEPEAKSTFELTLTTPAGETVLSNTPIKNQKKVKTSKTKGSLIKTTFETTPRMPTYLLAFVYGELKYKEAKTKQGTVIRSYATADNVDFTKFALNTAVKCLEFYNEYFNIPYPLPNCDLVALPDFAAGAMENWGCITFREQALLVDPANTSLATKQHVAMVVAHELAHQWFGNLVTMRWWTDLWLNEGFASWVEHLAVDHLFPGWQMWTQFIVDEQQNALKLDSLEHTHPVEVAVGHPDEIHTIFDTISYSKGASVIHMLQQHLGAETFRDGLRYYLKKHEYGNTDTTDLWAAMEEVSDKPVKEFMHGWTSQSGYPILRVSANENAIKIEQQRFLMNPKARQTSGEQLWPIALLDNSEEAPEVLTNKHKQFVLNDAKRFKLNVGQSGFFRTIYNASHQRRLGEIIKSGNMPPLDRLGILSDVFEAAKGGYIDTTEALTLLENYEHEDNAAVWDIIAANLSSIRAVMDDEEIREILKPFTRQLIAGQLKRLGWEEKPEEAYFDKLLRPTMLALASVSDESSIVDEALARFKRMKKPENIHPDIRGVIYGTAARNGGRPEFEKLLKMHDASMSSEERTVLVGAITGFRQPELIKLALEQVMGSNVRLQDVTYWIAYSFMNRHAKSLAWDWMVKNWKWLAHNLGNDLSFYRYPIYSARGFSDATFLPNYKKFFNSVMSPAFDRSVKQGIEIIECQSAWKARDIKLIKAYLQAQ